MADDTKTGDTPSPLALWNALVQAKLNAGIGVLTAYELVSKEYPGLWEAAMQDSAARRPVLRRRRYH